MALKRRIWIAGPLLAMLVVMLVVLPPRPFPDYRWNYGHAHRDAVGSALRSLQDRVADITSADSLARLAESPGVLRSSDGLISVLFDRSISRDSAQHWLEWLSNELALVPGAAGVAAGVSVPIVVAFHSDTTNWTSVSRRTRGAGASQRCVVEVRLRGKPAWPGQGDGRLFFSTDSGERATHLLGWCTLYARFGGPGLALARWSGIPRRDGNWYGDSWSARFLSDAARDRGTPQRLPASLFRLASCASGNGPACRQALGLDSASNEQGRVWGWYGNDLTGFNAPTRDGFLASLLASEPPERFATLWRSELPVGEALASAYGRDASELVMRWAQRRFKPTVGSDYQNETPLFVAGIVARFGESRGRASEAIASFGWVALLLGVAALIAKRQQSLS